MAYYLDFSAGTDTRVNIPEAIPIGSTSFRIDFDWAPTALTENYNPILSNDESDSAPRHSIYQRSNGEVEVAFIIGGRRAKLDTSGAGLQIGVRKTLTVIYNGSTLSALIDSVPIGSVGASGAVGGSSGVTVIGDNVNQNSATMRLYGVYFQWDGSEERNYSKQTLSGANDTTLPNTLGGNDGTLVNFPTDNSQWVFFDDGGGAITADVDYTIPAPTFTSTASVTLPAPIADGAFTIPAPTFAATADVTIPSFSASVSFAIPAPTFSGTASVTLPNPAADVAYAVSVPTFSVNADASLPQPSADVAFSVNSPQFAASATATEPGFNASVNFTVNTPTFSGNASATLPQPNADVNFTVSAPTFSVVAIVGGIAIIVDDETNITLKEQSTNIDLPALSNNLEI